jgi:hypothetical protein
MKPYLMVAMIACIVALPATAQVSITPNNGGTGADGAFAPVSNTTLDTDVQSVYEFTSFSIPTGVTVSVTGSQPITIKVLGSATVSGTLNASGAAGANSDNQTPGGVGGAGGPGGGTGGTGGCDPGNPFNGSGQPGTGRSPGQPGTDSASAFADPVGGGGGGGNATAGAMGGPPNSASLLNTSGAGGAAVFPVRAGSGGGGGACDVDSPTVAGNNDGGDGAIEICGSLTGTGTAMPAANTSSLCLMVTDACPLATLSVIGNPNDIYVAAISATLGPPIPLGGGLTLDLNITDLLFQLTFPVNTLGPIVSGLSGTPNGVIGINLSSGISPDSEGTVYVQAVSLQAGVLTGASAAVPIRIKF